MLSYIKQSSDKYLSIQQQISQNQTNILAYQKLSFPESKAVDLASHQESQKIGQLFELPIQEQLSIQNNLDMLKLEYTKYEVSDIDLI